MGNHCSVDNEIAENELEAEKPLSNKSEYVFINDCLKFKNYKEYSLFLELFSKKVSCMIDKVADYTGFSNDFVKTPLKSRLILLPSSNYRFRSNFSLDKLFNIMQTLYYKINTIYSNSYCFSRQELGKVSFDLISRYLSYEDNFISDEIENSIVADKIIKRLNFFTEEFPLKLKSLDKILRSKKIHILGYDSNYRLTFYIYPNSAEALDDYSKSKNRDRKLTNIDYITYIFFVIEFILPSLIELYKFSDEINVYIDFNNKAIDPELIRIILHYFNQIYPLCLNIVCIDNYDNTVDKTDDLTENFIAKEDPFNCVIFSGPNFTSLIKRHFYPSCIPIKYGGSNDFDIYSTEKVSYIDHLVEFLLTSILIKQSK